MHTYRYQLLVRVQQLIIIALLCTCSRSWTLSLSLQVVVQTSLGGEGVTSLVEWSPPSPSSSSPSANVIITPGASSSSLPSSTAAEPPSSPSTTWELIAGTKLGRLQRVSITAEGDIPVPGPPPLIIDTAAIDAEESSANPKNFASSSSSLPIYSLAFSHHYGYLFVGGADRYVSVYKPTTVTTPDGGLLQLDLVQRLGPHTGWVKDVVVVKHNSNSNNNKAPTLQSQQASDNKSLLLHSIGCNCIETWKHRRNNIRDMSIAGDGDHDVWKHVGRRSVDSSALGCTLSSDLLCLLTTEEEEEEDEDGGGGGGATTTATTTLWAGGVDGRIHCWTKNKGSSSMDDHHYSFVVAHAGRVNQLLHYPHLRDPTTRKTSGGLVFSASHDGTIKCWARKTKSTTADAATSTTAGNTTILLEHKATLVVGGGPHTTNAPRITALASLLPTIQEQEEDEVKQAAAKAAPATSSSIWLGFATHRGTVGVARLDCKYKNKDGDNGDDDDSLASSSSMSWNWTLVDQTVLSGEPMVHGLVGRGKVLVAGHAKGLTSLILGG